MNLAVFANTGPENTVRSAYKGRKIYSLTEHADKKKESDATSGEHALSLPNGQSSTQGGGMKIGTSSNLRGNPAYKSAKNSDFRAF